MRLKCHGCEREVKVRGEPPPGARCNVTCPVCNAVNRVTVPKVTPYDLNEAAREFMEFITKVTGQSK